MSLNNFARASSKYSGVAIPLINRKVFPSHLSPTSVPHGACAGRKALNYRVNHVKSPVAMARRNKQKYHSPTTVLFFPLLSLLVLKLFYFIWVFGASRVVNLLFFVPSVPTVQITVTVRSRFIFAALSFLSFPSTLIVKPGHTRFWFEKINAHEGRPQWV